MTADDFYRSMIEKLDREPFQPFAVELSDGKRVQIDRPNTVSIRSGVAACSTKDCIYVRVDSDDVKQIVDLTANLTTTPCARANTNAARLPENQTMTAETFYRVMIEKLDREPFRPFALELNDGNRVQIDRPNAVAIRGGVAVCSTKERLFVRVDNDDVKQVVDISTNLSTVQQV